MDRYGEWSFQTGVNWEKALAPLQTAFDPVANIVAPVLEDATRIFDTVAARLQDDFQIPLRHALPVKLVGWKEGDLIGAVFWILAFATARLFMEKVLGLIAGRVCVPEKFRKVGKGELPKKYKDQISKFVESCWKCFIYSFFCFIAAVVIYREDFLYRSAALWEGCYNLPCEYVHNDKMRFLYVMEMTYYVFGLFTLFFWEARRKDHYVMLAHHLVTLGLIGFSYCQGCMRIGSIIMILHDVCDVPMEFAKILRYSNPDNKSPALSIGSEVVFFSFFAMWIVARLLYFPLYAIHAAIFTSCYNIRGYVRGASCYPNQHIFGAMLVSLFVMHVYWSTLIGRIILRWFTHGVAEDVRED